MQLQKSLSHLSPGFSATLLAVLFATLSVQSISIFTDQASNLSIKPFHLIFIILTPLALMAFRISKGVLVLIGSFIAISILSSLIAYLSGWPLKPLIVNYIFALLVFITASSLHAGNSRPISGLQLISWLILIFVFVKLGFFWTSIQEYLSNPFAHPELFWLYGGGPNLEATWLMLNAAFFRRTKIFWAFWVLSFSISILYASRVGVVLGLALLFFHLSSFPLRRASLVFPLLIATVGVLLNVINPYALVRFFQIGEEVGSKTRLEMWFGAWEALQEMPITGYGAGGALSAIERTTGKVFVEDNLHNYFLQVLLDFGMLGFIVWLLIVAYILNHANIPKGDEYGTYLVLYLVAALVQFRGADPLFWFVMGLFVATRRGG